MKKGLFMIICACMLLAGIPKNVWAAEMAEPVELDEETETVAVGDEDRYSDVDAAVPDVVKANGYLHSGSLEMSKLSKAQILQLLQDNPLTLPSVLFDEVPNCAAPYSLGKVKDSAIQVALNRLNALRRLAGLPAVVADSELNTSAQYGAVLLATKGVSFGHYPPKPADMDETFYELGKAATSSSNLYGGVSFSYAMDGFMDDSDGSNVSRLGHRRWQLNPTMGKVGFGYAEGPNTYRRYTVEKVFDRSGTGCDYEFIGWPASGNFPSSMFEEHTAWSVTLNPNKYQIPVKSEIAVLLTRESDGHVWGFSGNETYTPGSSNEYFNVDNGGYGVNNCIIFRPDGIVSYDGIYTVQIIGLKDIKGNAVDFSYQVDFFEEADGECIELNESMFSIDVSSEEYDGTRKNKTITSNTLQENVDYVVSYSNNLNPGTAVVYIAGMGKYTGVIKKTFTIEKATREISISVPSTVMWAGVSGNQISVTSDNANENYAYYNYSSSDNNVVDARYGGYLIGYKEGTAVITVEADETRYYKAGKATLNITVKVPKINIVNSARGTVRINSEKAKVGEWVYFMVEPKEGYWLESITVTDMNGKPVELSSYTDNGYQFYMPEGDVTIKPVFKFVVEEHDCSIADYVDVDQYEWYHGALDYVVSEGLMVGTLKNNLEPNSVLTRAMLVQILYNREGKPVVENKDVFLDVTGTAWYANAINWAQSIGIVSGYPDGTFAPNRAISRQEMAFIIYGYAEYKGYDTAARGDLSSYEDSNLISAWALEAMQWANGEGVINGKSATKLAPIATATRAEVAQVLMNFIQAYKNN